VQFPRLVQREDLSHECGHLRLHVTGEGLRQDLEDRRDRASSPDRDASTVGEDAPDLAHGRRSVRHELQAQ
jgi:hypothetical protein